MFNEKRLSINQSYSCASCHQPDRHFTDGLPVAIGATGESHTKNTPTLYNVGFNASFGWQDDGIETLEEQHLVPLHNRSPVEMGYTPALLEALLMDDEYAIAFTEVFGAGDIDTTHLVQALATYVRNIRPPTSAFDRYLFFDQRAEFSEAAIAGMNLFFSERLGCSACHASFNLSGAVRHQVQQAAPVFHVMGVSGSQQPIRAPTLRMVQHTGPYMHDGSMQTLHTVLEHYMTIESERVPEFELKPTEISQLIAFLETL